MAIRCSRCGRELINPPKMIKGLPCGPVCYRKFVNEIDEKVSKQSTLFGSWEKFDEDKGKNEE